MPYEKQPCVIDLEAGGYVICQCGESENKPHCDGSHGRKGTDKSPMRLDLGESRKVAVCQCSHSNNLPLCDGSHSSL